MPLSGSLGIISSPGGTCTSISQAVDGNTTPPKSLTTLSVSAGKPAPHSMLEFYGYVPNKEVDFFESYDSQSQAYWEKHLEIMTTPAMNSGECFNLQIYDTLSTNDTGDYSIICVYCNSGTIGTCTAYDNDYQVFDETFVFRYGDSVHIELISSNGGGSNPYADQYLVLDVQNVVGSFVQGTTCNNVYIYAPTS
jgi:hypothetical protein